MSLIVQIPVSCLMLHASAWVTRNSIRRRLSRSSIQFDSTELFSLANAKNEKGRACLFIFQLFSPCSSTNTQTAAEHNKICTFPVPANVWPINRVCLINWMNKPLLFFCFLKRRNILFAIFFTHANRLSSDYFSRIKVRQKPYCLYCKDKDFPPIALYFPFFFWRQKFGHRTLILQTIWPLQGKTDLWILSWIPPPPVSDF